MKERFSKEGLGNFQEHEVLELLLFYALPRKDTNPIAHDLIERFGTATAVFEAKEEELKKVPGIGDHAATLLSMMPHISNYYVKSRYTGKKRVVTAQDAGEYAVAMVGERTHEIFAVITINSSDSIIAFDILEKGTVNETNISPRKVMETALHRNASKVILVHNHPSGLLLPSQQDRVLTKHLCHALEMLGVTVADHIIVGAQKYFSMEQAGLMPTHISDEK
ncbi:MAG: DNA repair protein RadC [Clostridia bacterium]|nr:DNA repair protein RadC [Clostridia bacterium]